MFKHKKVAAFILGLLISVSAVSPIYSAFAEGEEEASVTTEASGEESSEIIVSGEFSYSLTHALFRSKDRIPQVRQDA